MSTRSANEKKFKQWEENEAGGRLYHRKVQGQQGWYAIYHKDVDANENIIRFWQEIYNENDELEEIHEKYPEDKGHQKIKKS